MEGNWKDSFKEGKELVFVTSSSKGVPNANVVVSLGFIDDKLLIADCQMDTTIKNLKENKKICVVGGYFRIKGIAKIENSGKFFDICIKKMKHISRKTLLLLQLIVYLTSTKLKGSSDMASFTITYFVHGTTTDNENNIATGWRSGTLSETGRNQAVKLGKLTKDRGFDAVFCSDLKRASESAKLAFGNRFSIVKDRRLRECNYGDMTGTDSKRIEATIIDYINKPFPNGESYKDVERRMRNFLEDLMKNYNGKNVAIVAHRAPQLALDVIINGKNWLQALKEDWRLRGEWKPGWEYILKG